MMRKILVLAYSLVGFVVFAQKTHTVEPKENPYSISKKYGIAIEDLYKMNPQIKNGKLNIGDVLVINKKATTSVKPQVITEKPLVSGKARTIVLQPKQTIYGITKQYHITEADLRKLNPDLDSHMKIGDEVTLPAENVTKYADKNAFNREFAAAPKPVETPSVEVPKRDVPTPKSDEATYVIQPKDNYYRITKAFGISQKDLFDWNPGLEEKGLQPGEKIFVKNNNSKAKETYKMNPQIKNGKLNIGDVLVINKKATTSVKPQVITEKPLVSGKARTIVLQPKQTIYGITKQYHITEADLRKLNPDLDSHMKIGDEVTLPAENVTKYADKNAFNREFAAAPKPVETPSVEVPKRDVPTPKSDEATYVIQPKDNYYRITKAFGISQKDLFDWNPGLEEKGLQPGEKIFVKNNNSKAKETYKMNHFN